LPSRLVVLALGDRPGFFRAINWSWGLLRCGFGRAVDFHTGYDDPGDPRRLVGHGDWSDESPRILRKPYRKADLAEMLSEVMEQ